MRSDDLGSSSMYRKVCGARIIPLGVSGLGFRDVVNVAMGLVRAHIPTTKKAIWIGERWRKL